MRSIRVQTVVSAVTMSQYERCSLGMPANGTRSMERNHLLQAALQGDTVTPVTQADITATGLFAGNHHYNHYDDYMGYGMRMIRARNATMDDEYYRSGRWQHVMKISANVFGMPQGLP